MRQSKRGAGDKDFDKKFFILKCKRIENVYLNLYKKTVIHFLHNKNGIQLIFHENLLKNICVIRAPGEFPGLFDAKCTFD